MEQTNHVERGYTRIEFLDQYGEKRIIHNPRGRGLRLKKHDDTISHVLNRAAGGMIGARIKARRLAAGLTLDELLTKAGLVAGPGQGKARMWEIENAGQNSPTRKNKQGVRFGTLYALAIALECEPFDLMPTAKEVAAVANVALTQRTGEPCVSKITTKMAAE